jgi:phospholipid-translocating ATPase
MKRRPSVADEPDTDEERDGVQNIDPELRLRTVRTAASTIAESIRHEQRAERRKTMRRKRSRFFRREKKQASDAQSQAENQSAAPVQNVIAGKRRNVYVNMPLTAMEVDANGEPIERYVRNKVRTSKYTVITFIPKNLYEQFRRAANIYFLALAVAQGRSWNLLAFLHLLRCPSHVLYCHADRKP